ncbi:MAG TPA: type II toxin-antitoxin system VapC family toxin [Stellaceae bacterium]|jgi:ribonuclease VapC|nr:type II toxin-antitoxin system VapC family toxin [Stellaceae bacterium]
MFLDASVIVAILGRESDATAWAERLSRASKIHVSALSIYEAALGLARRRNLAIADASRLVEALVEEVHAEMIAIDTDIGRAAIDAFERFGKGRHAAGLNLGDCFAYARARQLGVPLLCTGDDFARTDIAIA